MYKYNDEIKAITIIHRYIHVHVQTSSLILLLVLSAASEIMASASSDYTKRCKVLNHDEY